MINEKIIGRAIQELENKSLGVTEQYLEVLNVVYENGKPKVERVDTDGENGIAEVYFTVQGQQFYLVVYVDIENDLNVTSVRTEPYLRVYFKATSETQDLSQLLKMTTLQPTESWDKGDLRKTGKSTYTFSSVRFLPNPEPDEFEDKLKKLLDYLEQDSIGVKRLVECANGQIMVAVNSYISDSFNPTLNKEIIRRMGQLNLEISFDSYTEGIELRNTF